MARARQPAAAKKTKRATRKRVGGKRAGSSTPAAREKKPRAKKGGRGRQSVETRAPGPPRVHIPLQAPDPKRARRTTRPAEQHPQFELPNEALVEMWYLMLLTRQVGERWFVLNRQGKAPFVITGQGHEATQVGTAAALIPGTDWIFPYYRDIGVVLTLGMTVDELMLNVFAKATEPTSGGRQMPAHWSARELNIVSQSSPVGTQIPQAAGVAWAMRYRGEPGVAVAYLGEGSTSQGDFYEGLNFAAVHRLPLIVVVENNGYALTEVQEKEMSIRDVADRAAAFDIRGITIDGNDLLLTYRTMQQIVDEARRGEGPILLECKTYRTVPHSSDDDDSRYRTRDELEAWLARDPLQRFRERLEAEDVLQPADAEALIAEAEQEVRLAEARAQEAPDPDGATLLEHLFANGGAA